MMTTTADTKETARPSIADDRRALARPWIRATLEVFGIELGRLLATETHRDLSTTMARRVLADLLRREIGLSYSEIAAVLGYAHACSIHAVLDRAEGDRSTAQIYEIVGILGSASRSSWRYLDLVVLVVSERHNPRSAREPGTPPRPDLARSRPDFRSGADPTIMIEQVGTVRVRTPVAHYVLEPPPSSARSARVRPDGSVYIIHLGHQVDLAPGQFEYVTLPPEPIPLALTPRRIRALYEEHLEHRPIAEITGPAC